MTILYIWSQTGRGSADYCISACVHRPQPLLWEAWHDDGRDVCPLPGLGRWYSGNQRRIAVLHVLHTSPRLGPVQGSGCSVDQRQQPEVLRTLQPRSQSAHCVSYSVHSHHLCKQHRTKKNALPFHTWGNAS